jgi:hypothetical protein
MGIFTSPVTDAERRAWQDRSYQVLGDLLKTGRAKKLPVVQWTLSEHAIVGECLQPEYPKRRLTFEAWVEALELGRWDERTHDDGHTHLRAYTKDWNSRRVSIAVMADIWPDDTTEEP